MELDENIHNFINSNPSGISIDLNKINSHSYLTSLIFGNNKYGDKNQQFSLLLEILKEMEMSNPFIGGVLTNLSYRYNEEIESRGFIFPNLYKVKKEYDNRGNFSQPINVRWLISSTNTLGTTALMQGNVKEAKLIFERGLKKYSLSGHTPLIYMNLCMIYFQYSLIKYSEGRINHSLSLFEKCYYLTASALNEIYNVRNDYASSMKMDCEKLIELGLNSLRAIELISKGKNIVGSRVVNSKSNKKFEANMVLSRFKFKECDWIKDIEGRVNNG